MKNDFSVLMSVYYKEKVENLILAIDSIINQTLKPKEFIIVLDGKLGEDLDNCLSNYEKKYDYIKLIRLEKNLGLGKALNEGMKYCNYEYIARMDSDDISLPSRFENQMDYLIEHQDIDVLGGNIMEFDSLTNEDISLRKVPYTDEDIKKFAKKRNPMNHVTVIFKKESVIECGGYLDCPYFEDYYLWIRMMKNNKKFMNLDQTLVRVRAGLSMSSRRGNIKYIKCIKKFEKEMYKMKIIPFYLYIENVLIRSVISIIPNKTRYKFYQKKLRK